MERLVDQWLKCQGKLFEGGKPKTKKQAEKRFKCYRLAGGCTLQGIHCARRHQFAVARGTPKQSPKDSHIYWAHRDDRTCALCPDGAARAKLLNVSPMGWREAYKAHKKKRNQASIKMSEELAERERQDEQSDIDWPIDARPRKKEWE